jgi:hypothetical protein
MILSIKENIMAGQAALCSRDEVRSKIKAVEKNANTSGSKAPKMSGKTTSKQ